jgi:hypothetical protein
MFTGFLLAITNFHPFLVSKDLLKQYILHLIDLFKSEEAKSKIGDGVKEGWRRRRETIKIQEGCHVEWCNVIAEAARVGFYGEEELYWNSYKLLKAELERERIVQGVQRKQSISHMKSPNQSARRAPQSLEHRKKIAEAIRAKWADPVRPLSFIFVLYLHASQEAKERMHVAYFKGQG